MSHQRARGQPALVYRTKTIIDARGHQVAIVDTENPTPVTAVFVPQRSSRAEVAGQQDIDVTRMIVSSDTPEVTSWSRVSWDGSMWDVVVPPAYHHGTRHTRHYSIDIRRRPS
ncbi:phage head-tail adapter protein [Micromonospora sp. NBC_01813]|uniref:phage head-tail adapter protein n=1 Tax=Micromonospora sp. NBC_01813 TaxID=2975988 RepID=UPI002DDBE4D4|nr:phage head-tail adapter protein [Micromonospora sp. NBC_01813]WSA11550.1 phage head-tail adapter protein [Micromonospora sp. NBC_01813]